MPERIRDYFMVGQCFETDGTVENLNEQLEKLGLYVLSPHFSGHSNYEVVRLRGFKKETEYELIPESEGLGRVIIGEVLSRGSATRADFYTAVHSGKTLVDYIRRVKKDFPDPDVIIVEQKEGSE